MSCIFETSITPSDTKQFKNISEFGIESYEIGDLVMFDTYRESDTLIVSKDGKLVKNPDYSDAGYLSIPIEVTQYIDDPIKKYSESYDIGYMPILELAQDHKFILNKIGKISKSYNCKIFIQDVDQIEIIVNGNSKIFDINDISLYQIKQWYIGLSKPNTKLKLFVNFENEDYEKYKIKHIKKIKIPTSWTVIYGSSSGGSNFFQMTNIFTGPRDNKENVIKKIKKFYKGFNYELKEIL